MHPLPPHWTLYRYDQVGSTNTLASEQAALGAPEGTVIVAQGQDAGRGRWGRTWESPHGQNLYISVVLRPKLLPRQVAVLSLVAGLAGVRMLADDYQIDAQVKWPNDLWIKGRKVGGVLAELQTQNGDVASVILGLGLNINAAPAYATSLAEAAGRAFSMEGVAENWCHHLHQSYHTFLSEGFASLQEPYGAAMALKGETVRVEGMANEVTGVVKGVDAQGWLQLAQPDGTSIAVDAGEVIKLCYS